MQHRRLGSTLSVSALGLGCMGMSYAYGPSDEAENLAVLQRYVDAGGNFLDTAEIYGPYANEALLAKFFKQPGVSRDRLVVATKFGFRIADGKITGLDSSPENIRKACDGSLLRLGIDCIDLYYQHRVDPAVPIEETVGAMAELVLAGKVRFLGLSEASPETLRRAQAVHPIAALQSEYSLWTRDPEKNGVLETCRALGIGFVPYSPLGRGFLTGQIRSSDDLDPTDWRHTNPRFQGTNLQENLALADRVRRIAADKGCTPAQLALAWVLAQGDDLVPIPGTKRLKYLDDNLGSLAVSLTPADLASLDAAFPPAAAVGERYAPAMMAALEGKSAKGSE